MRSVTRYSLSKEKNENQRSILACNGKTLDMVSDGSLLEAQFELKDGCFLIWLTDESPYDEGLHIYLLNKDGSVADALEAGVDFTAGILKIIKTGENWVEFEFFSNKSIFRLEVTKYSKPRVLLPTGWKYKRLFSMHRLVIHEIWKGGEPCRTRG